MNIEQAKENWDYAQKALAEIHPSFKLHQGMPYGRVVVGFKEDVNPHNMFSEYFRKAVAALGERFKDIWFDFFNLDDFYTKHLSLDLTQVAKEERRVITLKDREERLDSLLVDEKNITLVDITTREVGHLYSKNDDYTEVNFGADDRRRFPTEDLLRIGAELRSQRIILDVYSDKTAELLAYDHPDDVDIPTGKPGISREDFLEVFSEKPEGQ
ncbi:MAG: hypothetical protein KAT77_02785 [Nanoarchaeota archaeon]|nr:hypothetical protein [Nanoarchaeota archaeon]